MLDRACRTPRSQPPPRVSRSSSSNAGGGRRRHVAEQAPADAPPGNSYGPRRWPAAGSGSRCGLSTRPPPRPPARPGARPLRALRRDPPPEARCSGYEPHTQLISSPTTPAAATSSTAAWLTRRRHARAALLDDGPVGLRSALPVELAAGRVPPTAHVGGGGGGCQPSTRTLLSVDPPAATVRAGGARKSWPRRVACVGDRVDARRVAARTPTREPPVVGFRRRAH